MKALAMLDQLDLWLEIMYGWGGFSVLSLQAQLRLR
jgi:hypothetical protein